MHTHTHAQMHRIHHNLYIMYTSMILHSHATSSAFASTTHSLQWEHTHTQTQTHTDTHTHPTHSLQWYSTHTRHTQRPPPDTARDTEDRKTTAHESWLETQRENKLEKHRESERKWKENWETEGGRERVLGTLMYNMSVCAALLQPHLIQNVMAVPA